MNKNLQSVLVLFILGISIVNAKPVSPEQAKGVAISFYMQNSVKVPQTVTLFHTEISSTGEALYYVFNINANDGFVIVAADDVVHPIIGYNTQKQYVLPKKGTTISNWMKKCGLQIAAEKAANYKPKVQVVNEWAGNFAKTNAIDRNANGLNTVSTASVAALVQSEWNQSPYYNDMCPGDSSGAPAGSGRDSLSVTGCNATAMSQIMRFWSYPAQGTGSSSYCDCGTGFTRNYGTLSANYGATTYNWANMDLAALTGPNMDIATINYQCGVSVHMDYAPSGSGSYVISYDSPFCAQNAYCRYFGYDSTIIQGLRRVDSTDAAWVNMLKAELSLGRPVQYVGTDPHEGGHTWICDGFDSNDFFHMNWGWGGAANGFYCLTLSGDSLNSTNGNYCCDQEALIGIQPVGQSAGINQLKSNINQVIVYPNPSHNTISVKIADNSNTISITDIMGQTVVAEQKVNGLQTQNMDISNLANGVYFIKLVSKNNQASISRFIKN